MLVHVGFGTLAVLAGFSALILEKGSTPHRVAGHVFFVSMLVMAAVGAWIAYFIPITVAFLAGLFTCYLVLTGWLTVRRAEGRTGAIEGAAFLLAVGIAILSFLYGFEASEAADGLKDGYPPEPYYFFGALALIGAMADLTVFLRRGIRGRQRIARHLWRMLLGLWLAAGSLFTGPGASAFPESLQGTVWLTIPENLVLLGMLVWLVIALVTKRFASKPAKPGRTEASSSVETAVV